MQDMSVYDMKKAWTVIGWERYEDAPQDSYWWDFYATRAEAIQGALKDLDADFYAKATICEYDMENEELIENENMLELYKPNSKYNEEEN